MKRAHWACHNDVAGNSACHQFRQRISVRAGTPSVWHNSCVAACPAGRADSNTTSNDKYTRRPRKRTDTGVVRLRQIAQHKLKRVEKSARTAAGQPRGLRG